jgi:hypothetical protein
MSELYLTHLLKSTQTKKNGVPCEGHPVFIVAVNASD